MIDEENLDGSTSITRPVHFSVVHTWRIEGYEQYFSSVKCHLTSIHSSIFGHEDDPGTKWTLQLFPKGDKDAASGTAGSENLSFFINLDKSSDLTELPAKYSVVILGNDRSAQKVTGDNTFKRGSGWGRSKFMKLQDLINDKATYLVDDVLNIRCTVQYTKHVTKHEPRKKRRNSNSSASTEPVKILNTDNILPNSPESPQRVTQPFPWHDVTFLVSGSYIRAHKWILAASSPMLAQLVRGCESLIKVDGVDPDGFSQMIRYIYTGDCDVVHGSFKLMAVANKYKLVSLFSKCEDYLLSIIDKKNCFMLYSIADMCSSARLKTEATKMIETVEFVGHCSNKLSGTVAVI